MKEYDSSKNTAAYLGMTDHWLRVRRMHGDGPPFLKFGRTIRYNRDAVDAWTLSRKQNSTAHNPHWPSN